MRRRQGFYERWVFPWLNDTFATSPELTRIRREVLADARGTVLEIGFGSGQNLPCYSPAVDSLVAIEPNEGMHRRFSASGHKPHISVGMIVGEAEHLPVPDRSIDTVVSTLTLCSVSNPTHALAELRRVVKDDGRLIVIEHGLSEEPGVARWQNRLNGIQNVVACGCNLNRRIDTLVDAAGFRIDTLHRFFVTGVPRTHGWFITGTAAPQSGYRSTMDARS